jgi:hypothetical protein
MSSPSTQTSTKISFDNSEKLIIIGSNTCNILAISSIRVDDIKIAPEVGASTKNFNPSRDAQCDEVTKCSDVQFSEFTATFEFIIFNYNNIILTIYCGIISLCDFLHDNSKFKKYQI